MKIISWNCNGAFRKKYHLLEALNADLLIIQECEDPSRSSKEFLSWAGENYLWTGNDKNKGIGVFAKSHLQLEALDWESGNLELFLPFSINKEYHLIGVWTKQAKSPTFKYIGQFWKYLQLHKDKLRKANQTIIIGDFNSNSIWDVWDRWWNHSDVVKELADMSIESAYHLTTSEKQGEEKTPTLYLHRRIDRPYHIDYAFLSRDILLDVSLKIGSKDEWLEHSDHMPLILTL